ncbi:M12 family metallopeptidase [Aquimarina macrocephali]|uniref:M12 family metallopeptidase n=1 Tax=Aquimarina macrocephali TaxID=666563 RepID=UPI0004632115|nr:M12 family metallopeptidase [Aquimarina macrocephali]
MKSIKLILSGALLTTLFISCEKQEETNTMPVEATTDQEHGLITNDNVPSTVLKINGEEVRVGDLGNGEYLFNGDMAFTKEGLSSFLSDDEKANWGGQRRWTNNTIYYQFAQGLSSGRRSTMLRAMRHISSRTRVRFVQGRGSGNYVSIFTSGNGTNYATVGMRGGAQSLSISTNRLGIAIHELGHTIGLYHEHQRRDRDSYVTVNYNNIPQNFHSDYRKKGQNVGSFDWRSIMLYPTVSRGGGYEMVRRSNGQPITTSLFSNSATLSSGDVACINRYYR